MTQLNEVEALIGRLTQALMKAYNYPGQLIGPVVLQYDDADALKTLIRKLQAELVEARTKALDEYDAELLTTVKPMLEHLIEALKIAFIYETQQGDTGLAIQFDFAEQMLSALKSKETTPVARLHRNSEEIA